LDAASRGTYAGKARALSFVVLVSLAVVLGWWRLRRPHPREFDLRLDGFASSNLRPSVLLVNARPTRTTKAGA